MKEQGQKLPYFIAIVLFIILLCAGIYEKNIIVSSLPSSAIHNNLENLTRDSGESKTVPVPIPIPIPRPAPAPAPAPEPKSDLNADKIYEYDDGIEIEDDDDEPLSTQSRINRTDDYTPTIYSVIDWTAFTTFYGCIAGGILVIGAVALYYVIRGCGGCQSEYKLAHSEEHSQGQGQGRTAGPIDDMGNNMERNSEIQTRDSEVERERRGFKILNQAMFKSFKWITIRRRKK